MYKILNCKTYQYLSFSDHNAYGIALKQNYDHCKTIAWNDHIGKLQMHVSELPYYHPWWHHKVIEERLLKIPHVQKEIEALEVYKGRYYDNAASRLHALRIKLNELTKLSQQII
jgi:hypothetical protein